MKRISDDDHHQSRHIDGRFCQHDDSRPLFDLFRPALCWYAAAVSFVLLDSPRIFPFTPDLDLNRHSLSMGHQRNDNGGYPDRGYEYCYPRATSCGHNCGQKSSAVLVPIHR
jgi:hypothetical protein